MITVIHAAEEKPEMDWSAAEKSNPSLALVPPPLRACAEPWELEAGRVLFRVGDTVHAVFAVLEGEIRLLRRDRNGTEVVLQRSRGGFFAEASLWSKAYHCDAVAAAPSRVLRFPAQAFRDALDDDAGFREAWMTHLGREVRKLRTQCERLSLHRATDRILHYLEAEGVEGSVELTQTRKAWAAELGLTHEALYRALRRLQDAGVIKVVGDSISVAG